MPLKTKRWDDPLDPDDGTRILICRYRPRALKKELETWHLWHPNLGPSAGLLAAYHGKKGVTISWDIYTRRYKSEMKNPDAQALIAEIVAQLKVGQTITLLCSSACIKESRCHRTLLAELIHEKLQPYS